MINASTSLGWPGDGWFMGWGGVPDRRRFRTSPQIGRCGLAAKTARAAQAERKLAEARKVLAKDDRWTPFGPFDRRSVGLIADMRNIVAEGLTASEAEATLAQTSVPAAERAEVLRLLEAIESAEYGSGIVIRGPGDDRNG